MSLRSSPVSLSTTTQLTLLLLASLLTFGCSLRYDFSECRDDEDCQRLEQGGVFFQCGPQNTCVAQSIQCRATSDCQANESCESNMCVSTEEDMSEDMPDREDMAPDMVDDMPPDMDMGPNSDCSVTSECVEKFNDQYLCRENTCIDGRSEHCKQIVYNDDGEYDRVVFIGSIFPTSPPFGEILGIPIERSMELAIRDFNRKGGLPDNRKIAWVQCDSQGSATAARAAADHLATVVGVPAIVGPILSETFMSAATNVAIPEGVYEIAPTASTGDITELNDNDLIWRNITPSLYQAEAFVERIKQQGDEQIIVLYKDDAFGNDMQTLLQTPLLEAVGMSGRVLFLPYQDPVTFASPADAQTAYTELIQKALNPMSMVMGIPKPDSILLIGTTEAKDIARIYLGAHQLGPFKDDPPARMSFSLGAVPSLDVMVQQLNMASPNSGSMLAAAGLIEGISPNIFEPSSARYQSYALRYNTVFMGSQPVLASTTTFDATMLILFAYSTVGANSTITGATVATAMERMVDKEGMKIEFFSGDWINDAKKELSEGRNVDLLGVSGEMDFDLSTGDVIGPLVRWGIVTDGVGQITLEQRALFEQTSPPAPEGTWRDL